MSFINLLGSDVWSEADIVNRTEAELHSAVSKETELILSRKMIGFSLGRLVPSAQEAIDLTNYEIASYQAQQSGNVARADMALLQAAMNHEQGIGESTDAEVLALVLLRNPPTPEPEVSP